MTATEIAGGSQPVVQSSSSASGASSTAPPIEDDGTESTYHLKWIQWNSGKIPIVMQSRNGPCPLIATMNVLLLREKVKLPSMLEQITANQLLTYLGECIMDCMPAEIQNDENAILNLEQNIHDAMEILPKLKTGLDVNIRFTGITDFEYTPECIIFDLLRIPLYHGWLSDPNLIELQNAIGNQSYNQLVDNIITNKNSIEPEILAKVLIAEEFLERTASQLTLHGLYELRSQIKDNEIGILFRNNHFLTLFKKENEIYTLVTDHGYLTEDNIIWETLDNIEGAGRFFDSNFQVSEITNRQVSEFDAIDQRQQQLENDFLIALSLKEEEKWVQGKEVKTTCHNPAEDDFELAKRLQAEEDRIYDEMVRERQERERQELDDDRNKQVLPIDNFNHSQTDSSHPILTSETPFVPRAEVSCPSTEPSLSPVIGPTLGTFVPSTSSTVPDDPNASEANQSSSQSQDSQNEARPSSHKTSSRRIKSEKNLKESNCIVN